MPETIIDKLYSDNASILTLLFQLEEISMYSDLDDKLKKVLVMSAASLFETELKSIIETFVSSTSNGNVALLSLVKSKAVERQFHTFFQWNERNANQFFSVFGEAFSRRCREQVRVNQALIDAIGAFMELGELRNKLAHQNFGAFTIEKTSEEIFVLYKKALEFVEFVRTTLIEEHGLPPHPTTETTL